jgi:hypothetical protein
MFLKQIYTNLSPRPAAGDPLDHPDIARMSLRELADLPLPRPSGSRAPADDPVPRRRLSSRAPG